jgi:hypothetical protein
MEDKSFFEKFSLCALPALRYFFLFQEAEGESLST